MGITIVVDGGASGSRLALFDVSGQLVGTVEAGPASLTLGEAMAWDNIRSGIDLLASQYPGTAYPDTGHSNTAQTADSAQPDQAQGWWPDRLVMGLAGALQQERRDQFLAWLPERIEIQLVTDGYAQLIGATAGQAGICLAVGTGSVVHWLDHTGHSDMAGGWGFPAGDEGAGAWLGLAAVRHYIWHWDSVLHNSQVLADPATAEDRLLANLGPILGDTASAVQLWSACKNPTQLATLVPTIVASAEQGSCIAAELLQQGACACADLLQLAPPDLPIHLVGGLASVYQDRIKEKLRERLVAPRGTVFDGLYRLTTRGH